MLGYAVVDLETTGLHPGRHGRVVEIAIMSLAHDGEVTGEWSTLVNPHRDVRSDSDPRDQSI
jgi:DNA polymerase-3 subunit epsilon